MHLISRTAIQFSRLKVTEWTRRAVASLHTSGLLLATLFFAGSLTPSLLPRTYLTQGLVSGLSFGAGYGLGVFGGWLWSYLDLPSSSERAHRITVSIAAVPCVITVLVFLWRASEWQNSIRELMELEAIDSAHPFRVGSIALLVFALILAFARLFQLTFRFISHRLRRYIPQRIANAAGVLVAVVLFWSVTNGLILRLALRSVDASFQRVDARIEPDLEKPTDPLKTGSRASLVAWEDLGRTGRRFVSSGPTADEIAAFLGGEAREPIRVYVGLNSDDTIEARAQRALDELVRVGGFDRSVLILATPTGKGWVDPSAMDPIEYLHRGDVATVAVQYSYLPSWLSLMVEPEYGHETAEAVFAEIYGYWTQLPRNNRPDLYLHGASLGALNSERATDLYDVIADPFSGALWSGPPFRSQRWREITAQRAPDSPAWLPRFRDGSIVRFANQYDGLDIPGAEWGPMRIVYLQYASDPITFFEPQAAYRQPEWMNPPRGPDVSTDLQWFPVVTMLQLAVDTMVADQAPKGYGHVYAPEHYIKAWVAITDPKGWAADDVKRLKHHLRQ